MTKTYVGKRIDGDAQVTVTDERGTRLLPQRQDLRNHSPDGFEWGYAGSGPAQLSLAILADFTGDDTKAQRLYQHFKGRVIQSIDSDDFVLDHATVERTIRELDAKYPRRHVDRDPVERRRAFIDPTESRLDMSDDRRKYSGERRS